MELTEKATPHIRTLSGSGEIAQADSVSLLLPLLHLPNAPLQALRDFGGELVG